MDQLSNEILIRVLSYLDTYDLLQFCFAFKNRNYFLREKKLISSSDLSRRFECRNINLCKIISKNMNPDFIKVLKINGIYWIPAQQLRNVIAKLPILEELYAVDTRLGFRNEDIAEYYKLKKLAVSIDDDHLGDSYTTFTDCPFFSTLKYLYFKLVFESRPLFMASRLQDIFCYVNNLSEFWIENESVFYIDFTGVVASSKKLQKLVVKSKGDLSMYDFSSFGLSKTFNCKTSNSEGAIFERIFDKEQSLKKSIFEPKDTELEKAWEVFKDLPAYLLCGPMEQKLLYTGEEIKDIQFYELNFCHDVILCNSKYVDAALQILASKNCSNLKKLKFRSCLLQDFQDATKQEDDAILFKKPRVGVRLVNTNHPFEKTSKNLRNLGELEIYRCPGCNDAAIVSAYPLIANFENLQKLTLEVPLLLDGIFLKQVLTKCQNLQCLNLTSTAQNGGFLNNLYNCIKYARSLKDFRLECTSVNLEKLFSGLCQFGEKKLLRILIKCDNITYATITSDKALFSPFLEQNPQLVFFF